ncbi:CAP domain-containing protein [Actinoplanes sp. DH11]|uniref:CAP domain-containing protein n=1 Tax=Actinoplanes sp. DH11 TaxID=2857011 RepID=UPI001E44E95D|nr:CAP domain-containing protein [Actinoplanes sp. DH11]
MPTPPNPRIRYALTALGALGLIGAGSAAIVAGSSSGDREIRLAATTPDTVATAGAAAPEAAPGTSAGASPSTPASASASPSVAPSASVTPSTAASSRPAPSASASATITSQARPKPSATKKRTRTPAPEPSRTTEAPSGGGNDSGASNSVTAEVVRLVNAERQKAGCSGLESESRLDAAAQKHSELQAEQNSMSHQLPGEASMGDRVTAEGYRWRSVGENVAAGYPSAASVMDGWMNSPGHKANILNCGYEEIGVGLAKSSSGTQYWTQNFAAPA